MQLPLQFSTRLTRLGQLKSDTIINQVETHNPNTTRLNKRVMLSWYDLNFLKINTFHILIFFFFKKKKKKVNGLNLSTRKLASDPIIERINPPTHLA
jgi:hypothetical protein